MPVNMDHAGMKLAKVIVDGVRSGLINSFGRSKRLLDGIGICAEWGKASACNDLAYKRLGETHAERERNAPSESEVFQYGRVVVDSTRYAESIHTYDEAKLYSIIAVLEALGKFAPAFALRPDFFSSKFPEYLDLGEDHENKILRVVGELNPLSPRDSPQYRSAARLTANILETVEIRIIEALELYLRNIRLDRADMPVTYANYKEYIRYIIEMSPRGLKLEPEQRADFVRLALKLDMYKEAMELAEPLPRLI